MLQMVTNLLRVLTTSCLNLKMTGTPVSNCTTFNYCAVAIKQKKPPAHT
jgi:hypothetical protein